MEFTDTVKQYSRCLFLEDGFAIWKISSEDWKDLPLKVDNAHIILTVFEGMIEGNINGHPFIFPKNGIADIVGASSVELTACSDDALACQIICTETFLEKIIKNKPPFPFTYVLETLESPVFTVDEESMSLFKRRIDEMESILAEGSHYFMSEIIKSLFWMLLLDIADVYLHCKENTMESRKPDRAFAIFSQFMHLITKYIRQHRSVGFYASQLCITPQYLNRTVKTIWKRSASETIGFMLAGEIVRMLEDTNLSIQEIADRLNFADQATLCKFFKRYKGCSPMQYRKSGKVSHGKG